MNQHRSPSRGSSPWVALIALLCINLVFGGAALFAFRPGQAGAQGGLTADQQATLEAVAQLLGDPADLQIRQNAAGVSFVNLAGHPQALLLAAVTADGEVVTRCVGSLDEAAAFLAEISRGATAAEITGAASFDPAGGAASVRAVIEANPALRDAALATASTTIRIINTNRPGEGFNDPTPATPVGGNTGTTVGQQRLRAFEYAAALWAASLQSTVPIEISASFSSSLFCSTTSATLGSATAFEVLSDFRGTGGFYPGAERADTWYPVALANKRAGTDLSPDQPDILTAFNSRIGTANCLPSRAWYYGFDGNEGSRIDLVTTLIHEFAHGLGFQSFVQVGAPRGELFEGRHDIWNYFLTGKVGGQERLWVSMSQAERAASLASDDLVWGGSRVTAAAAQLYPTGNPRLTITGPAGPGPFDGAAAAFGPLLGDTPLSGGLAGGIDVDEDGSGALFSSRDACTPVTNGSEVNGRIALVERGPCAASVQARNLQAAGAVAALIVENTAATPPRFLEGADTAIRIPVIGLTQADGAVLRTALAGAAVSGQLAQTRAAPPVPGTDTVGRARMYAPVDVRAGSSVSHYDRSASGPNLLMEPVINSDVGQDLDLTDELLQDIGWYPDRSYNGLDDRIELNLGVTITSGLLEATAGQPVTVTVTAYNQGYTTGVARVTTSFDSRLTGATWTAIYTGGSAGPITGTGNLDQPLILPPGAQAVYTIRLSATANLSLKAAGTALLNTGGNSGLIDVSGAPNDRAVIQAGGTYIPVVIR